MLGTQPMGRREAPPDDRLRDMRGSENMKTPDADSLIRAALLR
jgi:hypothetical protein